MASNVPGRRPRSIETKAGPPTAQKTRLEPPRSEAARVPRVKPERGRGPGNELLHLRRVQPDTARRAINARATPREDVQRPIAEDLHADLGEDPERRLVDRLDLVRGQHLDRTIRVHEAAPRQARDAPTRPACPAPRRGPVRRARRRAIHAIHAAGR